MKWPQYTIPAALLLALAAWSPSALAAGSPGLSDDLDILGVSLLSDDELTNQSGRQGLDLLQMNDSEQSALLENNHINGVANNGGNTIDGGSFVGSVGFTTSIQNSGNNVLIQDTTLVNIVFQQ